MVPHLIEASFYYNPSQLFLLAFILSFNLVLFPDLSFIAMAIFIAAIIFYAPNYFGHPDNSIPANPLVTPHSIVPEWYFLPLCSLWILGR
jgi:hypothetical protein